MAFGRSENADVTLWQDGGAEGVRTPDLLNAIQALYQLSYDPIQSGENVRVEAYLSKPFQDFLPRLTFFPSIQSQDLSPLFRDHRLMPWRVPHNLDICFLDAWQAQ